jgi:hypothetical protein
MSGERILRGVALLIAILAFVDPALTRAAHDRQTVVVLQAGASNRELALDVVKAIEPVFDVSRIDVPDAAAYVIAGNDLPEGWRPPTEARVFSVTPSAASTTPKILKFSGPIEVSLDSIAPLEAEVQVHGNGEREVTVALIADGVRLVQSTHRISGAETRLRVPLTFVPAHTGLVRLRVEASVLNRDAAVADRVIDVHARAWQVLAFDGRPSYAGTFVRRALESDSRFKVTTRVVTSRASAIQTNVAPSSLTDAGPLAVFDLIVVGGTEVLGDAEARALQRYLRDRRGGVILLPESMQGVLVPQLTGQRSWQEDRRLEGASISPVAAIPTSAGGPTGANDSWTASEFLWPARWPPLSETLATLTEPARASSPLSAVWQMPVGEGRLAVSSAIDGWRSRAGSASGFSAFWRTTASALAQATPPAVDIRMARRLLTPGEWAHVSVATLSGDAPTAHVIVGTTDTVVRLWPAAGASTSTGREWSGAFRAPDVPGRYRLQVNGPAGVQSAMEFLVVAPDGVDAPVSAAVERDGLAVIAASAHRGRVVPAEELSQLAAQISEGMPSTGARESWHPMRSIWWLVPFTLCASGEWWLRRHRGER